MPEQECKVKLTTWIDAFNFNRICKELKERGYEPPTLPQESTGTYAMNICDQYQADFTQDEMLAIMNSVICWTPQEKHDAKIREETADGFANYFFPENSEKEKA